MTDALTVLRRHLAATIQARNFHRTRGNIGKIEATIAAHKVMWLREIIYEITGDLIPMKDLR